MLTRIAPQKVVADVKCYHCGHISGQIVAERNVPLKVTNFVPRPGYQGPAPRPGVRLRCERCRGPVFLDNKSVVTPTPPIRLRPHAAAQLEKTEAA